MSVQDYNKLLTENITKSGKSDIGKINFEAKSIAKQLNLDCKIEQFENDLYDMEFRRSHNVFQKQLATDIKPITETNFVLVSADKTTNM